jgi:hypothetical protein
MGVFVCDLIIFSQYLWYKRFTAEESRYVDEILGYYLDDSTNESGQTTRAQRGVHNILE